MNIRFFVLSFAFILLIIFAFADDGLAMSKKPGRFDKATRECIKCHNMDAKEGAGPTHTPHLVGLDYLRAAKLDPTLTPANELEPELKFIEGKVSCITCHREYSKETHMELYKERNRKGAATDPMLRVDNRGSLLCLKCHRK